MDVPRPLGSRTVPCLTYQLLISTAHNNWAPTVLWLTATQSQSYFKNGGTPPIISFSHQAPWVSRPEFLLCNWALACGLSPYVTSSITWGLVYLLWICFAWPSVKCAYRTCFLVLLITSRHGPRRKRLFHYCCILLPLKNASLRIPYLTLAVL
jgi:hypothetical protein